MYWICSGSTFSTIQVRTTAGARRFRCGEVRNFLLGITGSGTITTSGGRVVKNAAGFDIPKLMVGSLGRLRILVEMTFKVFPAANTSRNRASAMRLRCLCRAEDHSCCQCTLGVGGHRLPTKGQGPLSPRRCSRRSHRCPSVLHRCHMRRRFHPYRWQQPLAGYPRIRLGTTEPRHCQGNHHFSTRSFPHQGTRHNWDRPRPPSSVSRRSPSLARYS